MNNDRQFQRILASRKLANGQDTEAILDELERITDAMSGFSKFSKIIDAIEQIKGDKGDKGDPGPQGPIGPQGDRGFTGPQGPIGPQGEKGNTGPRGPEGKQGPRGEKGDAGNQGKQGERGPAPDHRWKETSLSFQHPDGTWGEYVDLKGKDGGTKHKLGTRGVKDFLGLTDAPSSYSGKALQFVRVKSTEDGLEFAAASSAVTFVDAETPSGSINDTGDGLGNKTFTLASSPSPASSLMLFLNGAYQTVNTDYTLSGATITFVNAPMTGGILRAHYRT